MTVLRENKESLMAVLEAFVYDPLINWRLMPTDVDSRRLNGASLCPFAPHLSSQLNGRHAFIVIGVGSDATRTAELAKVTAYPQGPTRKLKADENDILNGSFSLSIFISYLHINTKLLLLATEAQENRNERALAVYNRVQNKLTGAYSPSFPSFLSFHLLLLFRVH